MLRQVSLLAPGISFILPPDVKLTDPSPSTRGRLHSRSQAKRRRLSRGNDHYPDADSSLVSRSIRLSTLKRSSRPRTRSLIRDCVAPNSLVGTYWGTLVLKKLARHGARDGAGTCLERGKHP